MAAMTHRAYGLSPRVRGNLGQPLARFGIVGSIPACAGEPYVIHQPLLRLAVYPRVCGGTADIHPAATEQQGLSPRVRGNPRL